jgi:hypothetical protein
MPEIWTPPPPPTADEAKRIQEDLELSHSREFEIYIEGYEKGASSGDWKGCIMLPLHARLRDKFIAFMRKKGWQPHAD